MPSSVEHVKRTVIRPWPVGSLVGIRFSTSFLSAAQKPTLRQMICFKTKNGTTINIMQRIGAHYHTLSVFLLSDDDGSRTEQIVSQFKLDGDKITYEILRKWIQGQGEQPVTWGTLIGVLESIGLSVLAKEIKESL